MSYLRILNPDNNKSVRQALAIGEGIKKLEESQKRVLAKAFPLGTTVRCYIMHGQVRPSKGDVIAYVPGSEPYLRLRLYSRARKVRDVPAREAW